MLSFEPKSERQRRAVALLGSWDFQVREDRPEGLIFNAWLLSLNQALYADELGPAFDALGGWNAEPIGRALSQGAFWCDDRRTELHEDCAAILSASLERALEELTAPLGDDLESWRWGDVHQAHFAHAVFGQVPVLSRLFDRRVPMGGDNYTLGRATPRTRGPARFEAFHGAGLRVVFDLADLTRSEFVLAMGQSGSPVSQEYDNLLSGWRLGSGHIIVQPSEGAPARRYFLVPAGGES